MEIIVATHNQGKMKEIREILSSETIVLKSLSDILYNDDIVENGESFFQNAVIKAKTLSGIAPSSYILSDDSGLEVDALDGAPGIYSARYAGENAAQSGLINKLINELNGIPEEKRSARFVCVMVVLSPEGKIYSARGECEGKIAFSPRGINGFGYDPVFIPSETGFGPTMAELSPEIKNRISHRAHALTKIRNIIMELAVKL